MRIDEMPAGREMDVLIWVNVFGGSEPTWSDGEPIIPLLESITIPHYSTGIADAWEVFLRFLDPNRTSLHPCGNGADGLWWAVYYDEEIIAHGRTASLAICRAALKAMGVTEC